MCLWNEWIQWVFSLLNQFILGILQSTSTKLERDYWGYSSFPLFLFKLIGAETIPHIFK